MADYLEAGFDSFLLRPLEASYTEQVGIESTASYNQISGSQVSGDTITSVNQTLSLDLQSDRFTVSEGEIERVELGRLSSGDIGLIIRDSDGNVLMEVSGLANKLQSSNQHVELDFNLERFLVKDEGLTPRVLLGKGSF